MKNTKRFMEKIYDFIFDNNSRSQRNNRPSS